MEAIRHILKSDSRELNILLPDNLVNEELEVIIFKVKDAEEACVKSTYQSQKGKLSKVEAKKMLLQVEKSRKEWP
ncbi:MAG: hypothetical protein ACTHKY_06485 [Ginsengibacter sp.]|jgi:hypothetical protein